MRPEAVPENAFPTPPPSPGFTLPPYPNLQVKLKPKARKLHCEAVLDSGGKNYNSNVEPSRQVGGPGRGLCVSAPHQVTWCAAAAGCKPHSGCLPHTRSLDT